jgi:hypothetical protein
MKSIMILLFSFFLFGCSTTVPVKTKFPEAPASLLEKCQELNKAKDNSSLSEIIKTVTSNYSLYHECAAKHESFIEWYHVQKKTFEESKK